MKHVGAIAVGALTTFVILAIMTGDIAIAAGVYIFSIICTVGISLVLWLPLWYGVGWIVIQIVKTVQGYLGSGEDKGTTSAAAHAPPPQTGKLVDLTERLNQELRNDPTLARNQVALLNYVRKAREKGLSNQQITLDLTNTGWPTDHINLALNTLNQQSNP
jgi:hypothetical protein